MPSRKQTQVEVNPFEAMAAGIERQAETPNLHGYRPHPKQQIFHESLAKSRLYIGGNRSGKTVGGVLEDILWATKRHKTRKFPKRGIRGRVVTTDLKQGLEKIILPVFQQWCLPEDLLGGEWETAYEKGTRTLYFANGSFIEFLTYEQELSKFAGTSRDFTHYDEEPPQDIYNECELRLADVNGSSWLTMTPVNGMSWVYDELYIKGISHEDPDICIVEIDSYENPYTDKDGLNRILGKLTEDERNIRQKGHFIKKGGLVFPMFSDTHIVDDFVPPGNWVWGKAFDNGLKNPAAWLWIAINDKQEIYVFDEIYEREIFAPDMARLVNARDARYGRKSDLIVGDPSISKRENTSGNSVHTEYARAGIYIQLGNNDVSAGIQKLGSYLLGVPVGSGQERKPNLYVTRSCTNLIKELRSYRWETYASTRIAADKNAKDVPHKKDDHAIDALRYFVMDRPDLTFGHTFKAGPSIEEMMEKLDYLGPLKEYRVGDEWKTPAKTQWTQSDWGVI